MAAVTAQVAMDTARALLNDTTSQVFSNAVLQPHVVQATRELQSKLYAGAASVVRKVVTGTVAANATTLAAPTDLVEPIRLWERAQASTNDADWALVTEFDPLPNVAPAATLKAWQWDGVIIRLVACTLTRQYKLNYWYDYVEPSTPSSSLVFIDAEVYVAPRCAALAAQSLGQKDTYDRLDPIAQGTIQMVLDANRGRKRQIVPVPGT